MKMNVLLMSAFLAILFMGCQKKDTPAAYVKPPVSVVGQIAQFDTVPQVISATVAVGGIQEVTLSSQAGGIITGVTARLGDRVKKGALLFSVERSVQKAAYDQAKVAREEAQLSYDALETLFAKGSVSKSEFLAAQSRLSAAKSQAAAAYTQYRDCQLTAPFSGAITFVNNYIEIGNSITPGTPVMRIVNIRKLKTALFLGEKEISRVKVGDSASLFVPAIQTTVKGVVATVAEGSDPSTGSFMVELFFENSDRLVKAGMTGEVTLVTGEIDAGIVLPVTAISPRGTVAVIHGDSAVVCAVEARRIENNSFIVTGINDGDTVVVSGAGQIVTGDKVTVKKMIPSQIDDRS